MTFEFDLAHAREAQGLLGMAGEAVWRATPEDENVGMDSNASGRRETCLSTERDGSGFTPEDFGLRRFQRKTLCERVTTNSMN